MTWIDRQMSVVGDYEVAVNVFAGKTAERRFVAGGKAADMPADGTIKDGSVNNTDACGLKNKAAKPTRSKDQCPGQEAFKL